MADADGRPVGQSGPGEYHPPTITYVGNLADLTQGVEGPGADAEAFFGGSIIP